MPFEKAGELLTDLMRLTSVSAGKARRQTEQAGEAYVAIQEQAVKQLEEGMELASSEPTEQRVVMEVDGAMVPLVGGEWTEVKTMVIGHAGETVEAEGERQVVVEQISSFSRLTDSESFARLSLAETSRRGVEKAKHVGLVSDGAEWIQSFGDYHRPDAVRILDFPHAAHYVGVIGQGVYGEGTPEAKQWLDDHLHRLKHHGASGVLPKLRALVHEHADVPDLTEALAYLDKREAQMQYPSFRGQGWPIGSGVVESANKLVVEARLKGAGMHWAREHVNPMLALRNIVCSDRWAQAWPEIATRIREKVAQRRRSRRQNRRVKQSIQSMCKPDISQASEAKVAVKRDTEAKSGVSSGVPTSTGPYRPAPDHPWRRSPIGRVRRQHISHFGFTKN